MDTGQETALRPFKPAMDVLMESTHFGTIYGTWTSWYATRCHCRPPYTSTTCTSTPGCNSTPSRAWATALLDHQRIRTRRTTRQHGVQTPLQAGAEPRRPGRTVLIPLSTQPAAEPADATRTIASYSRKQGRKPHEQPHHRIHRIRQHGAGHRARHGGRRRTGRRTHRRLRRPLRQTRTQRRQIRHPEPYTPPRK